MGGLPPFRCDAGRQKRTIVGDRLQWDGPNCTHLVTPISRNLILLSRGSRVKLVFLMSNAMCSHRLRDQKDKFTKIEIEMILL